MRSSTGSVASSHGRCRRRAAGAVVTSVMSVGLHDDLGGVVGLAVRVAGRRAATGRRPDGRPGPAVGVGQRVAGSSSRPSTVTRRTPWPSGPTT